MKYNGFDIAIGSVVDIDGQKRIVTKIGGDYFCSDPYVESAAKAKVEETEKVDDSEVVVKPKRRRKVE